jgi:hypothetical protein
MRLFTARRALARSQPSPGQALDRPSPRQAKPSTGQAPDRPSPRRPSPRQAKPPFEIAVSHSGPVTCGPLSNLRRLLCMGLFFEKTNPRPPRARSHVRSFDRRGLFALVSSRAARGTAHIIFPNDRIDKRPGRTAKCPHRRPLARERTGNAVRNAGSNAAAAPATVSGEPIPGHWGRTREGGYGHGPASQETCRRFGRCAGRGASAPVELIRGRRRSD